MLMATCVVLSVVFAQAEDSRAVTHHDEETKRPCQTTKNMTRPGPLRWAPFAFAPLPVRKCISF